MSGWKERAVMLWATILETVAKAEARPGQQGCSDSHIKTHMHLRWSDSFIDTCTWLWKWIPGHHLRKKWTFFVVLGSVSSLQD